MGKVVLWIVGGAVALFIVFALLGSNDPAAQAKASDRRTYEACMKDFNDPLKDPGAKATIIRPVCERMRDDFVRKYGREP